MLLNQPYTRVDKWESMNISTEDYAEEIKREYQSYFDPETTAILKDLTSMERYVEFKEKCIALDVALNDLRPGVKRTKAITDREKLEKAWLAWLEE